MATNKRVGIYFLFLAVSISAAARQTTAFYYSAHFYLTIPTEQLAGAQIVASDGPAIRFKSGQQLSALLITRELDNLPDSFNLHFYPEYILGLRKLDSLSKQLQEKFIISQQAIMNSHAYPKAEIHAGGDEKLYTSCGIQECIGFMVSSNVNSQVLMINGIGFTKSEFIKILKGD